MAVHFDTCHSGLSEVAVHSHCRCDRRRVSFETIWYGCVW